MPGRDAAVATVLTLMAVVLLVAAFLTERAAAAWPGRSGPVVYVGVRQGEHRYSYETTGLRTLEPGMPGSVRQLTSDPSDAEPQVSPSGRLIVFSRETDKDEYGFGTESLFVIGIDGGGLRQLTAGGPGGGGDFKPAFYPLGESVVFARGSGATGENDLYSIRLDGSGLRQLTRGPAREEAPTVSPSGRQIAFACGPAGDLSRIEDVCSMRPDGSDRRILTRKLKQGSEPFDPDFSPSGRLIAFTLGPGVASDVFTMRADGTRLGALTNRSPEGRRSFANRESGYASPSFAPGGKALVAVARPGTGPRLVRIPLRDPRHPQLLLEGALASAPVWAPG